MRNLLVLLVFSFSLFIAANEDEKDFIELSYGDSEKQKIDFYPGTSKKVLVWIHGGGWLYGDKRASRWIERLEKFFPINEDLNIFMVGYRLGRNTAPQAAEDVLCAYKFIEQEISKRDLSSEDITIMGFSSGGHLALMTGLMNSKGSGHECIAKKSPAAIINFFGITDIEKNYYFLKENNAFLNFVSWWADSEESILKISNKYSPVNLVSENSPPTITVHGDKDTLVGYDQALILKEIMGDKNQLVTVEGGGHWRFSEDQNKKIKIEIDRFMKKNIFKN